MVIRLLIHARHCFLLWFFPMCLWTYEQVVVFVLLQVFVPTSKRFTACSTPPLGLVFDEFSRLVLRCRNLRCPGRRSTFRGRFCFAVAFYSPSPFLIPFFVLTLNAMTPTCRYGAFPGHARQSHLRRTGSLSLLSSSIIFVSGVVWPMLLLLLFRS